MMKSDIEYFNKGKTENPKFWLSLGGELDLEDKCILDVGCGHGSLCVDMASKGAKYVLGIDTDMSRIEFAIQNVHQHYPKLKNICKFQCSQIHELPFENYFDYIISKAAFEHIIEPKKTLIEMKNKLKIGGRIIIGFAGLWNSPTGGHGRILKHFPFPYAHLIIPESIILNKINKGSKNKIASIHEYGLNKLSFAEYKKLFFGSGLTVKSFRVNQGNSMITRILRILRKIQPFTEYFTINLYCILEKDRD